jgi:hypothetical protein
LLSDDGELVSQFKDFDDVPDRTSLRPLNELD